MQQTLSYLLLVLFSVTSAFADQRTVEWPLDRSDYPVVPAHDGEPPRALIRHLVDGERALLRRDPPSVVPTPAIAPRGA